MDISRRDALRLGAVGVLGAAVSGMRAESKSTGRLPTHFPQMAPLRDDPLLVSWRTLTATIPVAELTNHPVTPPIGDSLSLYVAAYTYDGTLLDARERTDIRRSTVEEPSTTFGSLEKEVFKTSFSLPFSDELTEGTRPVTYVAYVLPETETPYEDAVYIGETPPVQKRHSRVRTTPFSEIRTEATHSNGDFSRRYNGGQYTLSFDWNGGYTSVRTSVLKHVLATKKPNRTPTAPYHDAVQNSFLRTLSFELREFTETEAEHVENIRRFAQTIPYFYDKTISGHMDYPLYAEQTLVRGGGDCEDKTALMMGMLAQEPLNYDSILVFPPNHVAGAVARDDVPSSLIVDDPTTFSVDGREYVYVDSTTQRNFGEMQRADKSEVRALYDGERWRRLNGPGIIRSTADGLKQWITQSYD